MELNKIYNEDCFNLFSSIDDKSIDLVLCDPPYGSLALKWDEIIPFDKLWEQYERVIKDDGVIVLFAQEPFTAKLICSNIDLYRYSWVWVKDTPTGFLNANYAPLKQYEDVCVFSKSTVGSLSKNPIRYNPQGVKKINKAKRNNPNSTWRKNKGYDSMNNKLNSDEPYIQQYTNYPSNILNFARDKDAIHPTQKPVALLEYLIRTYTQEGDLVLDNCSGSGSTAIACHRAKRNFICIEQDENYYNKSVNRLRCEKVKRGLI